MRIVQWGYKIPFVTLPPLRLQGQETTYPKGSLKWSSLSQSVQGCGTRERSSQLHSPGLYSRLFLVRKATGEWRPIIWSVLPQCLCALPELHYGDTSVIFRAPQQGQWLTSLELKDAYFHIGLTQQTDAVLSQRHLLAVHSTVIRVVNQSESISKILKPVLAFAHLFRVKIAFVHRRLVVKPRDTPGSSRAKHPGSSPCAESLGWFLNLERSDLKIPSQVTTYLGIELDTSVGLEAFTQEVGQLVFRSGGIHSTAVTTCCPVAPSTWTPSLSWETSALWSRVALMSDNTSAVAYLRNQGGGAPNRSQWTISHRIMSVVREEGNDLVPRYLLGHLKVLADHLSRRGQILKTDWSLNQTVADRIFRAWGRPFVDLFALGKNTKLAIYVSPIQEETSW